MRLALATSLAEMPPRQGSAIAAQLITDADLKVQRRAIESLAAWPMSDAIGQLLAAAERGSVLTRRAAIDQLQKRWPPAASFPRHAALDRQLEEIARLKQIWQAELAGQPADVPARAGITAEDEARAIAAVAALGAGSVADRRGAARNLAAEQCERPLPPVALEKLSELVEAETDGSIWIDVMTVIARSDSAAAERMASAAASHTNAEVRRRACAWFGAHPSDRGADVLVNCLNDQDASIVLAAAQALGMQPHLHNADPLLRLLAADDHTLRVAAAESLARLRSPAGIEALSRLTHDRDAKVRRLAATAIGNVCAAPPSEGAPSPFKSYQAQVVADLVQLLDDRAEVRRAATIALTKVTGDAPPKTAATAPSRAGALCRATFTTPRPRPPGGKVATQPANHATQFTRFWNELACEQGHRTSHVLVVDRRKREAYGRQNRRRAGRETSDVRR